jgi:hypothetical protein
MKPVYRNSKCREHTENNGSVFIELAAVLVFCLFLLFSAYTFFYIFRARQILFSVTREAGNDIARFCAFETDIVSCTASRSATQLPRYTDLLRGSEISVSLYTYSAGPPRATLSTCTPLEICSKSRYTALSVFNKTSNMGLRRPNVWVVESHYELPISLPSFISNLWPRTFYVTLVL